MAGGIGSVQSLTEHVKDLSQATADLIGVVKAQTRQISEQTHQIADLRAGMELLHQESAASAAHRSAIEPGLAAAGAAVAAAASVTTAPAAAAAASPISSSSSNNNSSNNRGLRFKTITPLFCMLRNCQLPIGALPSLPRY
mmetsp:Transcript_41987/g.77756  ORF Transcript_41987/g.77756 Transcript_41987/m.77756 type:complete len:141 (+) Transcript_41987:3124-3546(+)